MPSIQLDDLSSFGRQALKVDADSTELARLSGQIQRLDIETDSGLDRAVKLLAEFAERAQRIANAIQEFSGHLKELRDRSDAAAKVVAERAQQIGERRQRQNQLLERLQRLKTDVTAANSTLAEFASGSGVARNDQGRIRSELERLNISLKRFLAEALSIKDEAGKLNFKSVERDALAVSDALRSSSRKIDKVVPST